MVAKVSLSLPPQTKMQMTSKKKELGKGLRALLTNIENTPNNTPEKSNLVKELTNSIAFIPLANIEVNPFQPRTEFDPTELEELSHSIKVHGLIQPITVRSLGGDQYQLISGERRLRASKMAELVEVPAYIRVANDQEMLEMALIENIQRSELNAIEIAISYQRLQEECNLTHELLSDRVGKNRSTVTNYLRLLKLTPEIQSSIRSGEISMGHARALVGISDLTIQLMVFKKLQADQLSVRELEYYIRSLQERPEPVTKSSPAELHPEVKKITTELSQKFGSKVQISRAKDGKGQITIKFGSDDEFNRLYDLLRAEG